MAGRVRRGVGGVVAIVGGLVLLAALAALAVPLVRGEPIPEAGALWFRIDPGGLNVTQAVVERYVSQPLWQDVLFPVLLQPAWLVLAAMGLLVVLIGWLLRRR